MKATAQDIVRAAVEAAADQLQKEGFSEETRKLPDLFQSVFAAGDRYVSATIVTPSGDAGPLTVAVRSALECKYGKSLYLTEKADPSILGGAIVFIGDMRIDMSVRGALETVAASLQAPSSSH